ANWNYLIDQMSLQLENRTKGDVREWILPDFSTTTEKDRLIGGIALMGALKMYFEYEFILSCGIPKVTLDGTLDDWKLLRKKADGILLYGKDEPDLLKWHSILVPILDEFVESYQGNVRKDFWDQIAVTKYVGCGSKELTGWILAFVPF